MTGSGHLADVKEESPEKSSKSTGKLVKQTL